MWLWTLCSKVTGLTIRISRVRICKAGVVLRNVTVGTKGTFHIGTVLLRATLDELWQALQDVLNGSTVTLSGAHLKVTAYATLLQVVGSQSRGDRRDELSPRGAHCAPPTYVVRVLCSATEPSSQHTFRVWGCRLVLKLVLKYLGVY